jgi:hypothetical protein
MSTSLKKPRRADVVLRAVDQHAVVGVALGHFELAAHDVVQRAGVADDVDAVDVDARAFTDREHHVDGVGLAVGHVARTHVHEGEAGRARREGQGVGGLLDLLVFVQLAGADRQDLGQQVAVQLLQLGFDGDLAELVLRAFVEGVGDREAVLVGASSATEETTRKSK